MTGEIFGEIPLFLFDLEYVFNGHDSGTDLLEVPTIYKAYVRGYTPKIWPYMVQYLHLRILKFPLMFVDPSLRTHMPCNLTVSHHPQPFGIETHPG